MNTLPEEVYNVLFERIYRGNRSYVYRSLLRWGCTAEEAEDLSQEVFLKVFMFRDQLPQIICMRKWLRVIARNTYISMLRKKRLQIVSLSDCGDCCCFRRSPAVDDLAAWEQMELIQQTFPAESVEQRMLNWLVEGMSCSEMAGQMGISCQAVRSRLFRMRKKLSKFMYPEVC